MENEVHIFDFDTRREILIFADLLEMNEQIKVKRVHDGFTQKELATILGMGVSTLCEIETGERRIPRKYKDRIDSYLYREWYVDGELYQLMDE